MSYREGYRILVMTWFLVGCEPAPKEEFQDCHDEAFSVTNYNHVQCRPDATLSASHGWVFCVCKPPATPESVQKKEQELLETLQREINELNAEKAKRDARNYVSGPRVDLLESK